MRRVACLFVASASIVLGSVSPAAAEDIDVRFKWRSCENSAAGLAFRTSFFHPADYYGTGRYLIKSQIRWDKYTSAGWRALDVSTNQSDWQQINNPDYSPSLLHGDRTVWGNLYSRGWRAHVIVKLIKNRRGPRDKRVETVERFYNKGMFDERGSYCPEGSFRR